MKKQIFKILWTFLFLELAGLLLIISTSIASESYRESVEQLVQNNIKTWLYDPIIIDSIKAQNVKHAALTQEDITRFDKQWGVEAKSAEQPLIRMILGTPLSTYLQQVKAQHQGLFAEIFVMDNKGLNVGQSDITSDYWQGDEDKWQKTYLVGPEALFISERQFDSSSRKFVLQVSLTIVDPVTKAPIGAATIGVSLVELIQAGAVSSPVRK